MLGSVVKFSDQWYPKLNDLNPTIDGQPVNKYMSTKELDIELERRAELYDDIINDTGFLNDLFLELGATDKVNVLEKAGFNLVEEWRKSKVLN